MKLLPLLLAAVLPLLAAVLPLHAQAPKNCNRDLWDRTGNLALGFGITWGGAKATHSRAWGVALGLTAGGIKAYRDHRSGDRADSVGTNLALNIAGVMIGAAVAKPRPVEFAQAPRLREE